MRKSEEDYVTIVDGSFTPPWMDSQTSNRSFSQFLRDAQEPLLGEDQQEHSGTFRVARLMVTVAAVSLGSSFQFGFATGSLNNLEPVVRPAFERAGHPISIVQWALINSFFSVGGLIGSYGCVAPLARLGRKKTLLLANAFVFASSALMFLAQRWWVLLLGRVSIGVVAGVAQMAAGSYMTEIAPIRVRGAVGVCSQAGIVIGIAFSNFLTAPFFHTLGSAARWRYLFLVPSGFSLLQLLVLPWCPDSPSFLIRKKGKAEAKQALALLHVPNSANTHMDTLTKQVEEGGSSSADLTIVQLFKSEKLRKQVIVGVVLKIGVQFSGIDAIFYYSTMMFRKAGVGDPQLATTLLSLVNLAMTFAAMGLMDVAGRRALIITTWVGMCLGFAAIYGAQTLGDVYGVLPTLMSNLQVVAMVLIIVAFAVGVGNVEGFFISEIMPVYAKDTLLSVGQTLNWLSNLTVSTLFPIIFALIGRHTYLIFIGLTFGFGYFTYWRVPETKGKSLQQISDEFEKKY